MPPLACTPHPYGPLPTLAALLLALILDYAYPEARGVLLRLHPVPVAYRLARRVAPPGSGALRGAAALILALLAVLPAGCLLLALASNLAGAAGWTIASALILKASLGDTLLYKIVGEAARALERGDLEGARRLVAMIVRRDTTALGPGHLASAAVESLAENLVDAYTSPLLYTLLLGPLGALAQRTINTVDGAIGYKTPEYARAGRIPASLDTLANYLPARLTAATIILAAAITRGDPKGALQCLLESRGATPSPNHWPVMAATAGALRVRLEKPGHYTICPYYRLPQPHHIRSALHLARTTGTLYTAILPLIVFLAWPHPR